MKKGNRSRISSYNELLAIKGELRRNISRQEDSLNNDVFKVDRVYNAAIKMVTARKKGRKVFNNDNVLALSDLLSQLINPFMKNNKQKEAIIPVVSLSISVLVINLLNGSLQKKKSDL
jgi:archaellum component FlaF (FlaF/FlaG flagellin family)